jgi:hypothetical protein
MLGYAYKKWYIKIIAQGIGGVNLMEREQFIKNWEVQRQKGRLKYVSTNAGIAGGWGLAGTVLGSLLIYNSPSAFSFTDYVVSYFCVYIGVFVVATLKFMYEWGKNEEKYSKTLNEQ